MENEKSKWWDPPGQPTKRERQEAFRRECKEQGLSAKESMERASFFPILPPDKIKIVHCPDLPDDVFGEEESDLQIYEWAMQTYQPEHGPAPDRIEICRELAAELLRPSQDGRRPLDSYEESQLYYLSRCSESEWRWIVGYARVLQEQTS